MNRTSILQASDREIIKDVSAVPSLTQLVLRFARSKRKAFGEDLIGGELLAAAPQELANLYHPGVVSSALLCHHPVQHKGAQLQELYKGKGNSTSMLNHRDISLADTVGKCTGSVYREQLVASAAVIVGETQPAWIWTQPR